MQRHIVSDSSGSTYTVTYDHDLFITVDFDTLIGLLVDAEIPYEIEAR